MTSESIICLPDESVSAPAGPQGQLRLPSFNPSTPPAPLAPPAPRAKPKKEKAPRDWAAYCSARRQEFPLAMSVLKEALRVLAVKTHGKKLGRPPHPLDDKVLLCVQKVLRNVSYLKNDEWVDIAQSKKQTQNAIKSSTVPDFMNDRQLTLILEQLVTLLALPMADIETTGSVDSTGLGAPEKTKWVQVRGEYEKHKDYRKMHMLVGNTTRVILAAKVTVGSANDSPQFIPLLDIAKKYFDLKEICADAAYPSYANAQAVHDTGATPYFDIKKNANLRTRGLNPYDRMIREFARHTKEYLHHYHQRAQVESAIAMLKRKIAGHLKSKLPITQTNEALCLAIAHNLLLCTHYSVLMRIKLDFRKKPRT